jgi:hypothetical protein
VIESFCDWLSTTSVSIAFQSANWFVPSVQTIHIIAIAILLMSVYLVSLRLIGFGSMPMAATVLRLGPWIWTTLLVLLVTGMLLTITEPARELLNWVFRAKMLLVAIMAIIVALVQSRLKRDPEYFSASAGRRLTARSVGILTLLIGACIVTAGRWIAYV